MQRSTNYTFYLPENSDYRDISVLNWNFNKIDSELGKTNSDIAIFASGDNAPRAISTGQYVIWGGNLYTASASIASGTTLSTDNLTRVSIGGLNSIKADLSSDITTLKNNIVVVDTAEPITDLDSIKKNSIGRISIDPSVGPNSSVTSYNYLCVGSGNAINLFMWHATDDNFWENRKTGSGWSGWLNFNGTDQRIPQKILSDNVSVASRTFNIANSARLFIVGLPGSQANMFSCIVYATSTGSIGRITLAAGTGVTFDGSTPNRLTITFASATTCPILVFANSRSSLNGFTQIS